MVIYEQIEINGKQYTKAYSDRNVMIRGGFPEANYNESIDPADSGRTYTETNIPIDTDETTASEIVNILTGETP